MRPQKSSQGMVLHAVLSLLIAAGACFAQDITTLPVQGNVHVIQTPTGNTTVQVGPEGVVLVNTQLEATAPRLIGEVRKLTAKPVLFIMNTSLDPANTSGNAALVKLGTTASSPTAPATVAHENVFNRMSNDQSVAPSNWPTIEYYLPNKDFFVNGEAVVLTHMPNAHSDGDTVVFFRRSDVLAVGELFSPDRYPVINLAAGGSITGLIDAVNKLLTFTVPGRMQEGGTKVIPAHGRICEEAELVEYRDMLTIVRDRIADMLNRRMTIEQIRAARPTADYDAEYSAGADATAAFVDSIAKSLTAKSSEAKAK